MDRTEDINPFVFGLLDRRRSGSFFGPDMGQRSLLSDADFVLEPDLDGLAGVPGLDGFDKKGASSSHCCTLGRILGKWPRTSIWKRVLRNSMKCVT